MPDSALDELRRWEGTGGSWRLLRLAAGEAVAELCTCAGEPMGELRSDDPEFVREVTARTASAP